MSSSAASRAGRAVPGASASALLAGRTLAAGAALGVGAAVGRRAPARRTDGDVDPWWRSNHAGDAVTLWEGPVAVSAVTAGLLVAPDLTMRTRLTAAGAVLASGALGRYDDLHGGAEAKGLGGHLGLLRQGRVTTGVVKVVGIGAVGLGAGVVVRPGAPVWERLAAGALVAGSANLVNLLDLRAGRALKVSGAVAAAGQGTRGPAASVLAPVLGAVVATAADDLGARSMLGDCGANALGACLGVAGAAGLRRGGLLATLGGVVALTLASERVSFSRVIDDTPWLRRLDRFGRAGAPGEGR